MKGRYSECRGSSLTGINYRTVKCFETVHDKYENFPLPLTHSQKIL